MQPEPQAAQDKPAASPGITVVVRPATFDDVPFVMDSWLRSFGKGRTWVFRGVDGARFYDNHRKIVEELVARSFVLVACLAEVPDALLGWACAEKDCLHYMYVKNKYRRKGVATEMLKSVRHFMNGIDRCSHQTGQWKRFTPGQKLLFSPAHAFYKPTGEKHGA